VVAILKMATGRNFSMSAKFDMWVDNDVPNWFSTMKNFYGSPFSKWPPQYRTNSTLSDFNTISYMGRLWCPELIPDIKKISKFGLYKISDYSEFGLHRFHSIMMLSIKQ
jgi:hypothetical protein